ncbi:MAG: IPTL-CTERM sorting domain-containing protein [Burkholderiales bacterium]|nr:IPTL-CTERM sorting domain-containing protein [Burkholderiales bacterium]MBK8664710.1 IPTL-CTERM sorting domain-containing protein [Burkholderiales bacterium]
MTMDFRAPHWRRLAAPALALACLMGGAPAQATGRLTQPGEATQGCAVNWTAAAVMDIDLEDGDPKYPGLMTGYLPPHDPVNGYSNGGYITEVSPIMGHPGLMEMMHWYDPSDPPRMNWRLAVGTDHAISNASVTFRPAAVAAPYTFNPVAGTNSIIANWPGGAATYGKYTWTPLAGEVAKDNGDGSWTITLGNMAAGSATVFVLWGKMPAGSDLKQQYVATGTLTGTYGYGQPATCQLVNAVDDGYSMTAAGGNTASVVVNDTVNGAAAVIGSNATLLPGTAPAPTTGSFTMNADGTITVAPGTTPGVYQYPYQICGLPAATPPICDPAVATITVAAAAEVTPVPTLSQWGLMLLVLLLGGTTLQRRRGR